MVFLVKLGNVWCIGVNEVIEFILYIDMKLGNIIVKVGIYIFYIIFGENEWIVIISSDFNVWGFYLYNEVNDVVRIIVLVIKVKESIEVFVIVFEESDNGVDMYLGWGIICVKIFFMK